MDDDSHERVSACSDALLDVALIWVCLGSVGAWSPLMIFLFISHNTGCFICLELLKHFFF